MIEEVGSAIVDYLVGGAPTVGIIVAILVAFYTFSSGFGGAGDEERTIRGWAISAARALVPPVLAGASIALGIPLLANGFG